MRTLAILLLPSLAFLALTAVLWSLVAVLSLLPEPVAGALLLLAGLACGAWLALGCWGAR
jgi:hypothetical protein